MIWCYRCWIIMKLHSPLIIFMYLFNFVLANFINYGAMLIHSQVTIFISSMLWYRWSIIIDAEEYPKIDYSIVFDRLMFKIRESEKEHVKAVSKSNWKPKILSRVRTNYCWRDLKSSWDKKITLLHWLSLPINYTGQVP